MLYQFREQQTGGVLQLCVGSEGLRKTLFDRSVGHDYYTIAWNTGPDSRMLIDGVAYAFPANHLLPLMMNQGYDFGNMEDLVVFRFNREFYCVVDHDKEVSCVGFIFYGPQPVVFVGLDDMESERMKRLTDMFLEEMETDEEIKGDMLRTLLVRLIIKITRLAKRQSLPEATPPASYDLMRQYCLLVERHFRKERQVGYYAGLLHKSPKTLSNLFARNGLKSPLQIIHERLMLEARRLLLFTDGSVKEIAFDLGFEDAGHFGKFVKSMTGKTAGELRQSGISGFNGKNLP
jgi:AraC-like DNA-binding protein